MKTNFGIPATSDGIKLLEDIIITREFADISPKYVKLRQRLAYYEKYKRLDKPLSINKDNVLVDGYTRYVLADMLGFEAVPVKYV